MRRDGVVLEEVESLLVAVLEPSSKGQTLTLLRSERVKGTESWYRGIRSLFRLNCTRFRSCEFIEDDTLAKHQGHVTTHDVFSECPGSDVRHDCLYGTQSVLKQIEEVESVFFVAKAIQSGELHIE